MSRAGSVLKKIRNGRTTSEQSIADLGNLPNAASAVKNKAPTAKLVPGSVTRKKGDGTGEGRLQLLGLVPKGSM